MHCTQLRSLLKFFRRYSVGVALLMISLLDPKYTIVSSYTTRQYHVSKLRTTGSIHSSSSTSFLLRMATITPGTAESLVPQNVINTESSKENSFDSFDYLSHWYPVVWKRDLPLNRPVKVTVFDLDYVVAKTSDTDVIAMVDKCPHKQAAMSEGRITVSGAFQCAYHGWSFDGKNGQCVDIPQIRTSQSPGSTIKDSKSCATAVPATIQQNMVWIFPGGNLEKALLAPPPPSIPELDLPGYTTTQQIRDFPVDWPILLENIMDPDHGLFAHQAKPFDLYAATKDIPMSIEETFSNNGKGWSITSRVKAVDKLLTYDKKRRLQTLSKKSDQKITKLADAIDTKHEEALAKAKVATTTFHAPTVVTMGRRDPEDETTSFITAFYITPVGAGRSRFMSCNVAKMPFTVPRWIFHLAILNFLDEDTYLLATQQNNILKYEAEYVDKQRSELEQKLKLVDDDPQLDIEQQKLGTDVRRSQYVYRSPTEKLGVRLGKFFDTTLSRSPNRITTLQKLHHKGAFLEPPSRRVVLDRESQHLQICQESRDIVNRCNSVIQWSKRISVSVIALKLWTTVVVVGSTNPILRAIASIITPKFILSTITISSIASWIANKFKREFYFKFDESYRNKKVDAIPSVWLDQ